MANSNEMMALSKSFSRLEEERVYQIIDNYLEKNGNPLMIVNALSNGMQEVGQLFKNDE
ncbi:MAG: B12-binding domain-containing protein [Deltaproteobacteria bacterium]|nr:B12-binding domain-containing protein [Deltaproteobacteria bacterium]